MPGIDDSSSTVTENTEVSNAVPAATESPAPASQDAQVSSSEARPEQAETRESLLDAVKSALPEKTAVADGEGADASGAQPAPGQDGNQQDEQADPSPEEMQTYHPRTRKRIEQLLGERNQLRQEVASARAQAEVTTQLQSFLRTNDIARDDFALTLDLAAAMRRGDFKAFLEGVMPYVQLARESLGIDLPQDLSQAVQAGHMTHEAAAYVAQQRTAAGLAQARASRLEEQHQATTQAQQVEAFTANVESAVAAWEKGVRKSDPDFAQKEPLIRDFLPAVVREMGAPQTAEHAVAIAKAAYERANATVARFRPAPRATAPSPSSMSKVNGATPAPKSMFEAVQQGLAR